MPLPPQKRVKQDPEDLLDISCVPLPDGPAPPSAYGEPPIPVPIPHTFRTANVVKETLQVPPEKIPAPEAQHKEEEVIISDDHIRQEEEKAASAAIIVSQPALRDLQKEAVTFVPSSLVRRKQKEAASIPPPAPKAPQAPVQQQALSDNKAEGNKKRITAAPVLYDDSDEDEVEQIPSLSDRIRLNLQK